MNAAAMRYHGGKNRLAPWIFNHLPPHDVYVEPFGGAAGVLLNKPRSSVEIYNDVDDDIVNFFKVLRDPVMRHRLIELLVLTPYSRAEHQVAFEPCSEPVERARRTAIRASMSFGSAGATKRTSGFAVDARAISGTLHAVWSRYPDRVAALGERLVGVVIEHSDASAVLNKYDTKRTLFYLDPPYVHSARSRASKSHAYRHDLSDDCHQKLIHALNGVQGMVVLSGYASILYETSLAGWTVFRTRARAAGNRGAVPREELLWLNCAAVDSLERLKRRTRTQIRHTLFDWADRAQSTS